MTLKIENQRAITVINKFFEDDITRDDHEDFPELEVNNLVCSLVPGDVKTYRGMESAKMTTKIVNQIQTFMKGNINPQNKKYAKINKPEICFLAYILQNIKNGQEVLYSGFVNSISQPENMIYKDFITKLVDPICMHDYDKFITALQNVEFPTNEAKKKIDFMKDQLQGDYEKIKWDSIRIVDLFHVYDGVFKVNKPSILTTVYDGETEKQIYLNLAKFLIEKKIDSTLNITNTTNLKNNVIKILTEYNPTKCTYITHDQPDMDYDSNISTLYTDYTMNQIDDFLNFKNGYCLPIDYMAISVLSNKGTIVYKNTPVTFNKDETKKLVTAIVRYYQKNKYFQQDFFNVLCQKYSTKEIDTLLGGSTYLKDIQERISEVMDFKNSVEVALKEEDNSVKESERIKLQKGIRTIINKLADILFVNNNAVSTGLNGFMDTIYTTLLSGEFANKMQETNIATLFEYTSNTIFELIGLLGYTYFSDMLTNMGDDGFKIGEFCTGKILDVKNKLSEIKITENENLSTILSGIKFKSEGIDDILGNIGKICTHGVGKMCIRFYLQCYEAFVKNTSNLIEKCKNTTRANASKLYPLPTERCDEMHEYFKLAPFVVKVPEQIEKHTGIRYLTCLPHDDDILVHNNPYKHSHLVSGFTSDLSKFYHLFHIRENSLHNVLDADISIMLLGIKKRYEVVSYTDSYYDSPDMVQKRGMIANYYGQNSDELLYLVRIPCIFGKNRIQRFSAYCDFTLNTCKVMTANLNTNNEIHLSIANFVKNKTIEDVIMCTEIQQIPKYVVVIQYNEPPKKANKHTNSDFVTNTDYANEKNNTKYFVTSLETLVSFPYSIDYEGPEKKLKAVVKTPNTRKDITNVYQYYKLVSEVLQTDAFEKIHQNDKKLFQYFEDYYLSVVNQPIQLQSIFYTRI